MLAAEPTHEILPGKDFWHLQTKNTMRIDESHIGKWWVTCPDRRNYGATTKAVEGIFGVKSDLTNEGRSIPIRVVWGRMFFVASGAGYARASF